MPSAKRSKYFSPSANDNPPHTDIVAARPPAAASLLPQSFFARPAVTVASALIGCLLHRRTSSGSVWGRIVEAEAYDEADPASHSYRGVTARTASMFGPAGVAYVYRSYGIHFCVNVSCGEAGEGQAVLLRAVEPLGGLQAMAAYRGLAADADTGAGGQAQQSDAAMDDKLKRKLCCGPGNLTKAFDIALADDGRSMLTESFGIHVAPTFTTRSDLSLGLVPAGILHTPTDFAEREVDSRSTEEGLRAGEVIVAGPRIGISVAVEKPWRFYIADCAFVSARRTAPPAAVRKKSPAAAAERDDARIEIDTATTARSVPVPLTATLAPTAAAVAAAGKVKGAKVDRVVQTRNRSNVASVAKRKSITNGVKTPTDGRARRQAAASAVQQPVRRSKRARLPT